MAAVLWPVVRPFRRFIERRPDGSSLTPGITAVIAARNEEYPIRFCLPSLVGFVDQIVCIDNGSEDGTLREMERFRDQYGDQVEVEIASMPGVLLGECRNEGLRRTRHQWHLRWDADMVASTGGPGNIRELRRRALADDRPRTIQIPRINLYGDLKHTHRLAATADPGEPILMRFGRWISYQEVGKFDVVRTPPYYRQERERDIHVFHLAGVKPDETLMYRARYFGWRETVNRKRAKPDPEVPTLEAFTRQRNLDVFGTTDRRSVRFRHQRMLEYLLAPYDRERYGDYPEILKEALTQPQRFEVVYQAGRPRRIDHQALEMLDYQPTEEDVAWDPEAFLRSVLNDEQCELIGIRPSEGRRNGGRPQCGPRPA